MNHVQKISGTEREGPRSARFAYQPGGDDCRPGPWERPATERVESSEQKKYFIQTDFRNYADMYNCIFYNYDIIYGIIRSFCGCIYFHRNFNGNHGGLAGLENQNERR